jgi:hypothetical protein
VLLASLYAADWLIGILPFAKELPFLTSKLSAAAFLSALVSLLTVVVLVLFGSDIGPPADALLDFVPRAGDLAGNLVRIAVLLYAYGAFQPVIFPFIPDYEWAYQSLFLGLTVFFLARAGLLMYAASESISGFIFGAFNPYKAAAPAAKAEPPQT